MRSIQPIHPPSPSPKGVRIGLGMIPPAAFTAAFFLQVGRADLRFRWHLPAQKLQVKGRGSWDVGGEPDLVPKVIDRLFLGPLVPSDFEGTWGEKIHADLGEN